MKSQSSSNRLTRRGAVLVLAALFLVIMVGLVAFGVDLGYIMLTRTQLQAAADSSAMAATSMLGWDPTEVRDLAKEYAGKHKAAGQSVSLADSDIEFGNWETATRTFQSTGQVGNAIRVTARSTNTNTFFGRIFGVNQFNTSASAVAMANPRDICFVVDLSGSMNDDTEPAWATQLVNSEFAADGYPTIGDTLMQDLYTDLGFGAFPGTLQTIGAPLGVTNSSAAYKTLSKSGGPLSINSILSSLRIKNNDSETERKQKTYQWIITNQLATLMPAARPAPTVANYSYWEKYLDYVIQPHYDGSRGQLPPSQWVARIDNLNNPNNASFPNASGSVPSGYRNLVGYRTYVQFMMDLGRNVKPDGVNYTQLSRLSPNCAYHNESTAGGTFSFPPREQPTHAARRALIAAMQVIKERNSSIADMSQRDWVSVVTYDVANPGPSILQSLTGDYDTAMAACTTMQAVGDTESSTATENGLITARQHLQPTSAGGSGRSHTTKVVVLLTDGMPNLYQSSNSTINNFMTSNPSTDFYSGSSYAMNAPLMQAMSMQLDKWVTFPVGIGLGCDYSFMDRMARMGQTDDEGQSMRGSGNPAQYEQRLTEIFETIIKSPKTRLVQ
jgi:Flp pilus assembly protein TadG